MEDHGTGQLSNQEHLSVDVLLVTATDVEGQTVIDLFQQETGTEFQRRFLGNKTYHNLGIVGDATIYMIQTEMGSGGPSGSLLTVQEAINTLSPAAVIMVGIAFGVNEEKQQIGDVLVSQQLWLYDLKRVGTDAHGEMHISPRGDRPSASSRLLDRFRSGKIDWNGAEIRFGLLLSGDNLVDNIDYRNQLLKFESEAIGGEMEAAGLYSAAQRYKKDWIVVKAICDWADGNKSKEKNRRQKLAAENAVRFVIHVLQQGGFASKSTKHDLGQAVLARPEPQATFSRESFLSRQQHLRYQTTIVEPPVLIGLVIDLSRSMINTLKKTKGLQQQDLQNVFQVLVEKATAFRQTPEASEIFPLFALFAFGYGFGNLRQGVNDTVNRLLSIKKPSRIIPTGEIRDLFEEVAAKHALPRTPNIAILNEFWDDYKSSLEAQFIDVGLGRSRFYGSLCQVNDRLRQELEVTSYADSLLIFVSDGQIDDASYEDVNRVTQEIGNLGVSIAHCYIGPQNVTMPKTFYALPEMSWPEQATKLFHLSSSIDAATTFSINVAKEAQLRGWLVPEKARLFVQINQSETLEQVISILINALKD